MKEYEKVLKTNENTSPGKDQKLYNSLIINKGIGDLLNNLHTGLFSTVTNPHNIQIALRRNYSK